MFPKTREYPNQVIVNGNYWDIKFCRKTPDNPPSDLGLCDPGIKTLFIRYKQSSRETFMTFCHELLHAIEDEYEIDIPHNVIYKLEDAIADLVENNPEIFIQFLFRVMDAT